MKNLAMVLSIVVITYLTFVSLGDAVDYEINKATKIGTEYTQMKPKNNAEVIFK